nr:serine/threonine-protein phosphatase 7 long form like [Quercus suber]
MTGDAPFSEATKVESVVVAFLREIGFDERTLPETVFIVVEAMGLGFGSPGRDEFGPSPIENSVLRFLTTHRSCAVWEGKDSGALKCRGRNDEFRKRRLIVEDLPPDDAYGPPFALSPLSIKTVWVMTTKNRPQEIYLVRYRQLLDCMHPNQVVWEPYQDDLAHLPPFCVAGRDVWMAKVPLVCFWLVEKHTPDRVLRQFGMVQEIPLYVDIDDALHTIDLRGKIEVIWGDKHYGHIQVWNSRARALCHGARLQGAMSSAHPYFGWYHRVTWRFVDHTSASLILMVDGHKQMLTLYTVGSPMYKQISALLKYVERLYRITAKLPLEEINGANPDAAEDTGQQSTSSNRASHSHGHRGAPHQAVSRPDPPPPLHASPAPELPPPPHASPAPEFPPPPHASPSPEIPPCTGHVVPDLEILLPTAHASSYPEIPSHTSHTFFDLAHLSFTPPSFDLGYDFSRTPPVMHTLSPLYSIGHIDHVPPHSHSMSFMPTPGLRIDPMTTGITHISHPHKVDLNAQQKHLLVGQVVTKQDTRLAPRNARSLTKEMQYPLPHLPNIIRDSINVKGITISTPSASNAKLVNKIFSENAFDAVF